MSYRSPVSRMPSSPLPGAMTLPPPVSRTPSSGSMAYWPPHAGLTTSTSLASGVSHLGPASPARSIYEPKVIIYEPPSLNTSYEGSPKDESVIDISICNVVCRFNVRCHLNLREIALKGLNVEHKRDNVVS